MTKQNVEIIRKIELGRDERAKKLNALTSVPFEYNKPEHTKALKKYIDNFEFDVNRMYLFQGMRCDLATWQWSGIWALGFLLPIPSFVSMFIYAGFLGNLLDKYSVSDFYDQLAEMKTIYNWCLKNGKESFDSQSECDINKLLCPDIQRMIKLMSPWCSTEFLIAWPKLTEPEPPKNVVSRYLASSFFAVSYLASYVTSSGQSKEDIEKIRELKINVEKGALDPGVILKLEQAGKYFFKSTEFREIMYEYYKPSILTAKNEAVEFVSANISQSTM